MFDDLFHILLQLWKIPPKQSVSWYFPKLCHIPIKGVNEKVLDP